MNKRVVVGMSGGVDSAVAAASLQSEGYHVIGVTLLLGHDPIAEQSEVRDARQVADSLGIEHVVRDERERFDQLVVQPFVDAYAEGKTPSPCPGCNARMKFPALLAEATERGADWVATGHYARLRRAEDGSVVVARAADERRDQSYFLCHLEQDVLTRLRLPLGRLAKEQVRQLAQRLGLVRVSAKKDSQDLCFVPGGDYVQLVERKARKMPQPGPLVDASGKILGRHRGVHTLTIGQRKGLGVSTGQRVFVCSIDPDSGQVVVGPADQLLASELVVRQPTVAASRRQPSGFLSPRRSRSLVAQIRYQHTPAPVTARLLPSGSLVLRFDEPVRAAAPGQVAVVYDGDELVAGGAISEVRRKSDS